MGNGQLFVTKGKVMSLHRIFDAAPVYSSPAFFKMGIGTTTPTLGDTALDSPVNIAGSPTKAVVSGYPSLDDNVITSTTRCLLFTTDCNGLALSEFALVNSDVTPQLFSRAVFTAINKNINTQVIFVQRDRVI